MTHEVILSDDAVLLADAGRLELDLSNSPPAGIALGLVLLRDELVSAVTLRTLGARWTLRLRLAPEERAQISGQHHGKQRLELWVGRIELGAWLAFFLRYYRDGVAEVDHMDAFGIWADGSPLNVTLKVALGARPVLEDEARSRLGINQRR
jgi:hypothetical protein